jgi:hypothetical protein
MVDENNIINATELRKLMTNLEEKPQLVNELKRINKIIQNEAKLFGSITCLIFISRDLRYSIQMILEEKGFFTDIYQNYLVISWSKTMPTKIDIDNINKYVCNLN